MEPLRFLYYLKLRNGKLLQAEGTSAEEAAREAGIKFALVKRHMPVHRILTEAEKLERNERFKELRKIP